MNKLKFGDKVFHNPANEKAIAISPVDDDGYLYIMYESTLEQELAHVYDCKIVDNDFIRRCQMAEQQITGYQQACYTPNDVTELLGAMGLKPEEWDYIKSEIGIEWLEDILKEEIESYLESKKK